MFIFSAPNADAQKRSSRSQKAKPRTHKGKAKISKPALAEILHRIELNYQALASLRTDLTMVRFDSQLKVADTSVGYASYLAKTPKHNLYVRIDWTKPLQQQIVVIGDAFELYQPRLNQVIAGKLRPPHGTPGAGSILAFMSMSKEQLKLNFKSEYVGQEIISGGAKTWHMKVTPIVPTSYVSTEIWVDNDGMVRQCKVTEKNRDTTTVLLSNIQKNVILKGEIFRLNYPRSVKKIKM
jgi:outer membrane lipoprotein-sorting protein